jgi:predicted kinase
VDRSRIIVLVGLPASGKSTWAERAGLPVLSSDATRGLLSGDETNQSINRLVFSTMRETLRRRLAARAAATLIDSTALTPWERRCWIRLAELHDCDVEAVFFDTPLEECLRRNASRARQVPEEALRRMALRLIPPSIAEGFQRVTLIPGATLIPASTDAAPAATGTPESTPSFR